MWLQFISLFSINTFLPKFAVPIVLRVFYHYSLCVMLNRKCIIISEVSIDIVLIYNFKTSITDYVGLPFTKFLSQVLQWTWGLFSGSFDFPVAKKLTFKSSLKVICPRGKEAFHYFILQFNCLKGTFNSQGNPAFRKKICELIFLKVFKLHSIFSCIHIVYFLLGENICMQNRKM